MHQTIAELLDHASERFGDQPFLGVANERCSFAEFVTSVRDAAAFFVGHGLQAGDRIAVLLPRCQQEAIYLLAVMLAGGVAVPVHGKLKDDQVRHVLDDCEPRWVITNKERTVALRDCAAVLAGHAVLQDAVLQDAVLQVRAASAQPQANDPHAAAVLLYTSGSTGRAKGIVQTQANLTLGAKTVANYLELTANDHLLALLSFSFDYGLNQLLSALHAGCQLTAADHLGVGELASLLSQHRPTGLAGVPSLWHEIALGLRSHVLTDEHGASLRYVTNSGGALRPHDSQELRSRWPHVEVFAMYGLTEAFRSAFLPPTEFDANPGSFGYAISGVELLLVSPTDGSVLHGPATGELVHAGALVAAGYWRRSEDDALRFRPDPRPGVAGRVVYSGDLVRRDEHGRHYFVARLDRMLKVHGHRVSPDEVAQAVIGMAGVGAVWVFGIDGQADGNHIVLCVVGDDQDETLLLALRRRCRARLPSYMVPTLIKVVAVMPLNANGKVDEARLRACL